jgi:hypothetical protein
MEIEGACPVPPQYRQPVLHDFRYGNMPMLPLLKGREVEHVLLINDVISIPCSSPPQFRSGVLLCTMKQGLWGTDQAGTGFKCSRDVSGMMFSSCAWLQGSCHRTTGISCQSEKEAGRSGRGGEFWPLREFYTHFLVAKVTCTLSYSCSATSRIV